MLHTIGVKAIRILSRVADSGSPAKLDSYPKYSHVGMHIGHRADTGPVRPALSKNLQQDRRVPAVFLISTPPSDFKAFLHSRDTGVAAKHGFMSIYLSGMAIRNLPKASQQVG